MTHYANTTLLLARKPAEPRGESITEDPVILLREPAGLGGTGEAGGHVACLHLLLPGLLCGELVPFPTPCHSPCHGAWPQGTTLQAGGDRV